jgi:bifunctional N-acetylglucosamine-1-phosphate-uridyltransferase/glucosamine-1-phosphate-acetyltransferase GlmU-like protein
MPDAALLAEHVAAYAASPLAALGARTPWQLTSQSERCVRELLARLDLTEFHVDDGVAVHRSASVETGAVLKAPLIIGAHAFVAAGAYLRGGCWLAERCTIGPGAELKSSFVFAGSKLAHFNFVGDSVLGADVNLEAGSIVCNYRNERDDKRIRVRVAGGRLIDTGVDKFGSLLGDGCRIGANAVIAPGALLAPGTIVARSALHDAG